MTTSPPSFGARVAATAALGLRAQQERVVPRLPPTLVERLQGRRLRRIVRHAYATVPFYRRAIDELGLGPEAFRTADDLRRLPLVDSAYVREHVDDFVSTAVPKEEREVFYTSGTTSGIRKRVLWDHRSLVLRVVRGERDRAVISRLAGERRLGAFAREFVPDDAPAALLRLVGGGAGEHRRLSIFPADFSSRTMRAIWSERTVIPRRAAHYDHVSPDLPFQDLVEVLERDRPRVIFSYGSYADQFLRYLDSTGRRPPLPRVWVYMSDMLSAEARAVADRLGCPLYSVYAAMEFGTIGYQCVRREGFHLNVDLCAVRIVDDEGDDVPAGHAGDVVVSGLDNRAMVLLNYRLGDIASLAPEPCPCGCRLPVLSTLEGRRSEVIRLRDGRTLSVLSLEGLFRTPLRGTIAAQVEQSPAGSLTWRIVPYHASDREQLAAALRARAREVLGDDVAVSVEFLDAIPRTGQGKFVRTIGASVDRASTTA